VVVEAEVKEATRKTTLRSEWRGLFKKDLTEPTLLEISGYATELCVNLAETFAFW
jgi:hypothetical protein